nr:unnamed protein product [Callosobruchus analis]
MLDCTSLTLRTTSRGSTGAR